MIKRSFTYLLILAGLLILGMGIATAQDATEEATAPAPEGGSAQVERGRYLTKIAGCEICHTPFQAAYNSPEMSAEDLRTVTLFEHNALDESRPFAGGRMFSLGPQGMIFSPNLTPDEATGLGGWTDEEIRTALQTGVTPEGRQLHPIMPYRNYNRMAASDLDAIIAYLRTLEPIANEVPAFEGEIPPAGLTVPETAIEAPTGDDLSANGAYLMTAVLPCSDCHTPLDQTTGAPMDGMYLAGGQPFEGPWGIVYSANITAHEETGIGGWSDEDITRVLTSGVRPDGRRLVLMPWQDYANFTENDLQSVVTFLRNEAPAVENEVPEIAIQESLVEIVDTGNADNADQAASTDDDADEEDDETNVPVLAFILLIGAVIIAIGGMVWFRTNKMGSHPA